jgi:hypothetical protein
VWGQYWQKVLPVGARNISLTLQDRQTAVIKGIS